MTIKLPQLRLQPSLANSRITNFISEKKKKEKPHRLAAANDGEQMSAKCRCYRLLSCPGKGELSYIIPLIMYTYKNRREEYDYEFSRVYL